ncbi:MAG TPA: hypothetical protein VFX86_03925 [Candidatus Saccharimonadales bacterium]|nr:hypothetical protein [Candidatus Saccharimonadales bacterium]
METNKQTKTGLAKYLPIWMAILLLLVIFLAPTVGALTTLSQGYYSNDKVALGSIVSLKSKSSDQVVASTNSTSDSMLGVIIDNGNSLLSLKSGKDEQVQVATNGTVQVSVSDINGEINKGDHITASPIKGVGMKATGNTKVIGIAQDNLSENESSQQTYTDKGGEQKIIKLGQVPVIVNVSYYYKQPDKTLIPSAIQNIANALAGKQVNATPILISAGIFIITLIVVVSIVYSMIHSSIISVGRNPMSQKAIYRDLIQLSVLVMVILVVALISIYMVLTKF